MNRSLFVIDAKNPTAVLIVRKQQDETTSKDNLMTIMNAKWQAVHGWEINKLSANLQKAINDL
jgi:hypothetical protein